MGLNTATEHYPKGVCEVLPVVGVRHQSVERAFDELLSLRFKRYGAPTISTPLYLIMPGGNTYTPWIFNAFDKPEVTANEIAAAVNEYGLPWMKEKVDLQRIAEYLEHEGHGFLLPEYRVPIALAFLGRSAEAIAMVEARDAIDDRSQYHSFSQAFSEWISRISG
ncbi:hypothetical protein [Actinopolymorpha alba]|uniref:hypothetical protein n=1 Tax=Actinopolymorpha alba TaxID=533267 RepID=UPI0012F63B4C|nr:hypothetical protein [Actinopolymorpha alba]